jgi:coenzyme F420-reducing hydrogenase beta subunit
VRVRDFLEQGRQVPFSGTPCQMGGLKRYLNESRGRLPCEHLLCVDLICHGVPSPQVWERYVTFRGGHAQSSVISIEFRSKNVGWKRFSMRFEFGDGTEYCEPLWRDPYLTAFLQNICLRPSCYACRFRTLSRQSDVTLADFWGVQSVMPGMDDDLGTSLVLVHSARGQAALDRISAGPAGCVECREVDAEAAVAGNPSAVRSVKPHPKRHMFFEELYPLSFDRLVDRYCRIGLASRARRWITSCARRTLRSMKTGVVPRA